MSLANVFNNRSVGGGGGETTSTWSTVLGNGASSGAHDPIIATTQKINYVDNIKIDSQLVTAPVLIGNAAVASGNDSIAIGNAATTGAFTGSVALGKSATVSANNQIMLGSSSISTVIPGGAKINTGKNLIFADGVNISGNNAANTTVTPSTTSVIIGSAVTGSGLDCVDIGASTNSGALQGCVCVGSGASANGTGGGTALGWNSSAGTGSTAIGWLATAATSTNSVALGVNASTGAFNSSVAIGSGAVCTAANQVQIATNTETTSIRGALVMNSAAATSTTLAGLITLGKVAGTPSGAASSGSVIYDSTNNLFYARDNVSWKQIQIGTVATPTLTSVLTAGNSTGSNNISVAGNQSLTYINGVKIGSNGLDPLGGLSITAVCIGQNSGNTLSANVASSTCVGSSAACSAANATSIGASTTCAGSGVALGVSAAGGNNSIAIGALSTNGGSAQSITIGASGTLGSACSSSIAIGYGTTSLNSITDSIVIGRATQIVSIDGIGIGRQTSSSGTRSISLGAAVANHANNSDCTLLGANISNTTTGNTGISILGASGTVTAGANSTETCGIGKGVTIPAGVTNSVYFTTAFAAAGAPAGTAVSIDPNGRFHANTSSIRYKQDVKPLRDPERILNLRAVDYAMKNTEEYGMACGCPTYILDEEGNSVKNTCDGLGCGIRDVGGIAEEVCNAGCEDFVVFAPDPNDPTKRQCRSIKYDRLTMPIIEVLKKQKYRMEFLEDENLMLADKITTLENSNDAMKVKLDWLESKIIQSA